MGVEEVMLWDPSPYLNFEAFSTVGAEGGEWDPVGKLGGVSLELKGPSNFLPRGYDFVSTRG